MWICHYFPFIDKGQQGLGNTRQNLTKLLLFHRSELFFRVSRLHFKPTLNTGQRWKDSNIIALYSQVTKKYKIEPVL